MNSSWCRRSRGHHDDLWRPLDAAIDDVVILNVKALTTRKWLVLLERCERVCRRFPVMEHPRINSLARQSIPEALNWARSSNT